MKCIIVVPPLEDFYFTPHRFSCFGARISHEIAEEQGWQSEIISLPLLKKPHKKKLPRFLDHLKPYVHTDEKGPTAFFTQYYRFGPETPEAASLILDQKPDVLFFSLFAFGYADHLVELAIEIRRHQPDLPLVAAGKGVKVNPLYFQQAGCFDFLITGEAETSLALFLEAVKNSSGFEGVPGLLWREQSQWCENPAELSSAKTMVYPFVKTRQSQKTLSVSVSLTRGCPLGCCFCANHNDRSFRYPQVAEVIDRVKSELLPQIKGRKLLLNFEDDNLLLCPDFFLEILRQIKKMVPQAVFLAENGLDYRFLTPERITKMVDLGFEKFNFTLGSFFSETMRGQNRAQHLEHFKEVLGVLNCLKVQVLTYFIAGFVDDTIEKLASTLSFLASQPTLVGMSAFYPIPGIPGWEKPEFFMEHSPCMTLGASFYPWNNSLSTQTLITAFRLTRYINLCKKDEKSGDEIKLQQQIEEQRRLYSFFDRRLKPIPAMDEKLVRLFFEKRLL